MATKTAESHAFRRAFDVSAPTVDEQWGSEVIAPPEPRQPVPLAAKAAAARARIEERVPDVVRDNPPAMVVGADELAALYAPETPAADPQTGEVVERGLMAQCDARSPYEGAEQCRKELGHTGNHKSSSRETWEQ